MAKGDIRYSNSWAGELARANVDAAPKAESEQPAEVLRCEWPDRVTRKASRVILHYGKRTIAVDLESSGTARRYLMQWSDENSRGLFRICGFRRQGGRVISYGFDHDIPLEDLQS